MRKLEYSEEAAIDIEEILNWIDITQGYEEKNKWADALWEHTNRLIKSFEEYPGPDSHLTLSSTPFGWNYRLTYTIEEDKIIIVRIKKL